MNIKEICLNISNTIKNYIDNKVPSKLSDLDNDLISSTAKVGQTVVVKNVDENGKPTEWEPIDFPEQAQPDWEQNDESQPDYVKNRTHYISYENPTILSLDCGPGITQETIDYIYDKFLSNINRVKIIIYGNKYDNEILYSNEFKRQSFYSNNAGAGTTSAYWYGDRQFIDDDPNTYYWGILGSDLKYSGAPICFYQVNDELLNVYQYRIGFNEGLLPGVDRLGSYTIYIYDMSENIQVYHKLDTNYLNIDSELSDTSENPVQNKVVAGALAEKLNINQGAENAGKNLEVDDNGNVTLEDKVIPDWDQNDETAKDYIKNRPFYSYYDYIEIGGNLPGTFSDFYDFGTTVLFTDSNNIGTSIESDGMKFIVYFDGVDYKCESKTDPFTLIFYAGNAKLFTGNDEDDTGEPFVLAFNHIYVKNQDEQHNYFIRKYMEVTQPIPLQYIPMNGKVIAGDPYPVPGWRIYAAIDEAKRYSDDQIDESLDYNLLKNKPFYEEVIYEDIISESTYDFTYQSSSNAYYGEIGYYGNPYYDIIISVNGVSYNLAYGTNSYGYPCWGDSTFESCPIYIDSMISEATGFQGFSIYISNRILSGSTKPEKLVTIRLYYISSTVVHQIDPKFIPSDCHTDVQINGTSIVKDGVANIPIGTEKLGLVNIPDKSSNRYIYIYPNGTVKIGAKSNEEIIERRTVSKLLASGSEDTIVRVAMCDGQGHAWTDTEKTGAWSRLSSIKTVMDEVAVAGASYFLGELTELSVVLPDDALVGQEITVSWYNGDTASTLSITGNMLDFDYTPSANTRSEISCLWDGTYWSVIGMSQDVPADTSTEEVAASE